VDRKHRPANLGNGQSWSYPERWSKPFWSIQMKQWEAIAADRNGDISRAVELYEASINDASEDALINLAVLYWQMTDYGLSITRGLSPEVVGRAGVRVDEVLDEAARRFPHSAAVSFWKKYIAWAELGDPFDPEDCRQLLLENPQYLEPAMYLYSISQGREGEREALMLLLQCPGLGTMRARYVASVIESAQAQASSVN
jgi:hypothetical protein